MRFNYIKQLINSEDTTSQTDNQIGNLFSDFHCSIVLHTFSKVHNFLISYPILFKLVLIGLSDFFAYIESKLSLEWTCTLKSKSASKIICFQRCQKKKLLRVSWVGSVMVAYRTHPKFDDIDPVVSVEIIGIQTDIDSFFNPPCVPMSFLGKALNPVPVWLMLVIQSMFGYSWVVSSAEPGHVVMLSDPFLYRTGSFTDVGFITSFHGMLYTMPSRMCWGIGSFGRVSWWRRVVSDLKTVRIPWLSRRRLECHGIRTVVFIYAKRGTFIFAFLLLESVKLQIIVANLRGHLNHLDLKNPSWLIMVKKMFI